MKMGKDAKGKIVKTGEKKAKHSAVAVRHESSLVKRVIALIETARQKVASAANIAQVYTYYEIGRQIVEEEQGGKNRAEYGRGIIDELAMSLTARFGKGWSARNLREIRRFFIEYSSDAIRQELLAKSADTNLARASCQIHEGDGSSHPPLFVLGWTHYTILMRIKNRHERFFYEMEARGNGWGTNELGRQIGRQLFGRLAVSEGDDKDRILSYIHRRSIPVPAADTLKDPYVLDFLGLPEKVDYAEVVLGLLESIRKATSERCEYCKGKSKSRG